MKKFIEELSSISVTETDVIIITQVGTKKREKRGLLLTGLPNSTFLGQKIAKVGNTWQFFDKKVCVLTGIAIFLHFFNGEEFIKIQKNPWNITCNKYDDDAKQHNGTSSILCVMFRTSKNISTNV